MTIKQGATTKVNLIFFLIIVGVVANVFFMISDERKQTLNEVDVIETQNAADHVQATIEMQYALAPAESVEELDLTRPYPAKSSDNLNRLVKLSKNSGLFIETDYPQGSMGQALALSTYVLTGKNEARMLKNSERGLHTESYLKRPEG